jgi:hypothetical protein
MDTEKTVVRFRANPPIGVWHLQVPKNGRSKIPAMTTGRSPTKSAPERSNNPKSIVVTVIMK